MDKDGLNEHLKGMDKEHNPKNVPPPNENPPDSKYQTKITGAVFKEKRDGSSLMFILSFEVLEGQCKGWPFDKFYSKLKEFVGDTWIVNTDKLDRLIQDLHVLKSCPDKWIDLLDQSKLDSLIGLKVDVELSTTKYDKGSFQFINLQGLSGKSSEAGNDDDVPF